MLISIRQILEKKDKVALFLIISVFHFSSGVLRINNLFPSLILGFNINYWVLLISITLINVLSIILWGLLLDKNWFRSNILIYSGILFALFISFQFLSLIISYSFFKVKLIMFLLSLVFGKYLVILPMFYLGFHVKYKKIIHFYIPLLIAVGFFLYFLLIEILNLLMLNEWFFFGVSSLGVIFGYAGIVLGKYHVNIPNYINQTKPDIFKRNRLAFFFFIFFLLYFLVILLQIKSLATINALFITEGTIYLVFYLSSGLGIIGLIFYTRNKKKVSSNLYSYKKLTLMILFNTIPIFLNNILFKLNQYLRFLQIISAIFLGISFGLSMYLWFSIWNLVSSKKERGYYTSIGVLSFFFSSPSGIIYGILEASNEVLTNWVPLFLMFILLILLFIFESKLTTSEKSIYNFQENKDIDSQILPNVSLFFEQEKNQKYFESLKNHLSIRTGRGKPPKGEYGAIIILLLDNIDQFGIDTFSQSNLKNTIYFVLEKILMIETNVDTIRKNTQNHLKKLEKQGIILLKEGNYYLHLHWHDKLNFY